jgi:hypothetical protein
MRRETEGGAFLPQTLRRRAQAPPRPEAQPPTRASRLTPAAATTRATRRLGKWRGRRRRRRTRHGPRVLPSDPAAAAPTPRRSSSRTCREKKGEPKKEEDGKQNTDLHIFKKKHRERRKKKLSLTTDAKGLVRKRNCARVEARAGLTAGSPGRSESAQRPRRAGQPRRPNPWRRRRSGVGAGAARRGRRGRGLGRGAFAAGPTR